MTDKYTYKFDNNLDIYSFFNNGYNIFNVSFRYMPPAPVLCSQILDLLNEAYEEGKKNGSSSLLDKAVLESNHKLFEENDKLKRQLETAVKIRVNLYESKQKWKENNMATNEALCKALEENENLKEEIRIIAEQLFSLADSNQHQSQ
jgi:hypothetical protein